MAASISRLRTHRQKAEDHRAQQLRVFLDETPDLLPERLKTQVIASLDRQAPSTTGWPFIMVSPSQNKAVILWLKTHSRQPINAMQLWAEMLDNMRRDTGEVALSRDELAAAIGVKVPEISRITGELEACGALIKKRERIEGMSGPGRVRYFVNPSVATTLTGQARDKAQAKSPKLQLVTS